MIQRLIPRIGFGWSMRVLFFIEIVMLTIAWFTIRTRLPPAIDVRDKSKGGWKQVKWIDLHAFKNPAYTMIVIGFGLVVFGLYTPFVSPQFESQMRYQLTSVDVLLDIHGRLYIALSDTRRWLLPEYHERGIDVWPYPTRLRRYVHLLPLKRPFLLTFRSL